VVINKSTEAKTINISVPGTSIRKWERYVTTGSKNLRKESDINASGIELVSRNSKRSRKENGLFLHPF